MLDLVTNYTVRSLSWKFTFQRWTGNSLYSTEPKNTYRVHTRARHWTYI